MIPLLPIIPIFYWSPHFLVASNVAFSAGMAYLLCKKELLYRTTGICLAIILILNSFSVEMEHYYRGVLQVRIHDSPYTSVKNHMILSGHEDIPHIYVDLNNIISRVYVLKGAIVLIEANVNDLVLPKVTVGIPLERTDNSLYLQWSKQGYLTQVNP